MISGGWNGPLFCAVDAIMVTFREEYEYSIISMVTASTGKFRELSFLLTST